MNKKSLSSCITLIVIAVFHLFAVLWQLSVPSCERIQDITAIDALRLYFVDQDYFMGLSYAVAAAFTVYSFTTFFGNRKNAIGGVIGGMTLTGGIYLGGCFLIGCCGSPMLPVYLGFFGSSFLGFAKPIVFGVTLVSVAFGVYSLKKKQCIHCQKQ